MITRKISAVLVCIAMVGIVFANTSLVFAGSPPSHSVNDIVIPGDWVVAGAESYTNEIIHVYGNITIPAGASLTLNNVTIIMNNGTTDRTYIEVQGNGALNMATGSIIQANLTTLSYGFWINQGATVSISDSAVHNAGNNTNMPPTVWSGIYISSSSVSIQNSQISNNSHGLLFDSCLPALFDNNNVSGNAGIGIGIGNWSTPAFTVTYIMSNNLITNNGDHGVYVMASTINFEAFDMNVSENGYGINLYANGSVIGYIHDCVFWRNNGVTENDAASIFMLPSEDGTVTATIERCTLTENRGPIWLGIGENDDMRCKQVTVNINNCTLIGNDGHNRFNANDTVTAKIVDNEIHYGTLLLGNAYAKGDGFRLGYSEDSSPSDKDEFPNYLNLEFSRNNADFGQYSDDIVIGGYVKAAAKENINAVCNDNYITGGRYMGGIFRIGYPATDNSGGWDWDDSRWPLVRNATVYFEGNEIEMYYEGTEALDTGGYFWTIAKYNLNTTAINNYIYSENGDAGGFFKLGYQKDNGNGPVHNLTAYLKSNTIIWNDLSDDDGGGFFRLMANKSINAVIEDNLVDAYVQHHEGGYVVAGAIWDEFEWPCENVTIDIINNQFLGDYFEPDEVHGIYLQANHTLRTNMVGNDLIINDYAMDGYDGLFFMRIGYHYTSSWEHTAQYLYANITDNNFLTYAGGEMDVAGGYWQTFAFECYVNMARNTFDILFFENDDGDPDIGGLFWIGQVGDSSMDMLANNVTAYLIDNTFNIGFYGDVDVGGMFLIVSEYECTAKFNGNELNLQTTYIDDYPSIGGVIRIGILGSGYDEADNTTAEVCDNTIRINANSATEFGGIITIYAENNINANVNGNDIELTGYYDDSDFEIGGFIHIGYVSSEYCNNIIANVSYNRISCSVIDDHYVAGYLYLLATNNISCNIIGNDFYYAPLGEDGSSQYLAGFIKVGRLGSNDGVVANNVVGEISGNNLLAIFNDDVQAGGAIKVAADDVMLAMHNNVVQGIWPAGDEDAAYNFGVRIGYECESQGILSFNVSLNMSNNHIGPGGVGSALNVGALNNLTIGFDGGVLEGAYYCDSYSVPRAYGNGLTLTAGNITASIANAEIKNNRGAGIYVQSVNDTTIDVLDCYIHDNYWHGIYLQPIYGSVDATGSIEDCIIEDNGDDWHGDLGELGSGLYVENAIVDIVNCTFDNPDGEFDLEIINATHVTALNTYFDQDNGVFLDSAAGFLTGGALPETNWAGVWAPVGNNGYFRVTIDGVTADVGPVNLAGVASGANVATAVTTALVAAGFTGVTCTWTGNEFVITSSTTGNSSTVSALSTHSGGLGTDISGVAASTGVTAWWLDCASNSSTTFGATATLLVQWYMHVFVEQLSSGVGLPGASVTIQDVTGAVVGTGTTGLDGYRRWFIVDEYLQNVTQSNEDRTYYTPHSVSATKAPATGSAVPDPTMDDTKTVVVVLDYITLPPVADAGPDQTVDEFANLTFDGSGSTDDWLIVNWTWTCVAANFTLYGETVNYSFAVAGVYNVTLTVTDYEGFNDTDYVIITVVDITPPNANAGPDQTVNEDTVVTFDGSGSNDTYGIDNYTWTFTDGTLQTLYGVSPTYIFTEPGVYPVTLTVSDAAGNTDTDTVIITVLDITPPVPDPGAGQVVPEGDLVAFDASGSTDNVGILSYLWTFNDGANDVVLTGMTANYTFALIGNYTVTLTCTDAAGNSASATTWVNVVDVTPPVILVVSPGESLTGVPLDWALVIVFSEPMNTTSVEAAFNITGTTVTSFVWETGNRYVTVNLDTLEYGTVYTFTVGTAAGDIAGNTLATAYTGTFTAVTAPPETPTESFLSEYWWIIIVIILVILLILQAIFSRKKEPEIAFEEEPKKPAEPPKPEEAATKVDEPKTEVIE